jgi:hypothetical protein
MIMIMMRLFVLNSLTVYHLFFFSEGSYSWRDFPVAQSSSLADDYPPTATIYV